MKKWRNYDDIVEASKLHKKIINSSDITPKKVVPRFN